LSLITERISNNTGVLRSP